MFRDNVSRNALGWMLAAQSVVLLPLFFYLPVWVPVVWLVATVWRIQIFRGVWPFPGYFIKLGLGLGCVGGLLASYSGKFAVEPMVGLLACSFALKVIEVHNRKGVLLIAYIGFIALAAQFLFSQTLLTMLYGVLSLVLLAGTLRMLFGSAGVSARRQLGQSGVLVLQSLPVMLILFLVIPRFGQLWGVPSITSTGTTGFGDSMSPGEISNLIQSNELAFRVTFESEQGEPTADIPPPSQRYWRGLVLDYFDGRAWRRGGFGGGVGYLSAPRPPADWGLLVPDEAKLYRYSVMLEPHQQHWLFTLMAPLYMDSGNRKVGFGEHYLLASHQPVATRIQYEVVSAPQYRVGADALTSWEWRRTTALPGGSNPEAVALAQRWQAEGLSQQEIIKKALDLFQQSFVYTLQPPVYGRHSVDEFLFSAQRGFCEHFSSSFVFLMRAAGIPARVVMGYQGGEFNSKENYLIVRQSDAHAWAEVWLPGRGWVRIDPTAAVAPSRIEQGLRSAVDQSELNLVDRGFLRFDLVRKLQQRWDVLGYLWHRWVLEYDTERQRGFLDRLLGGTDAWRIALFLLGSCALVIGAYLVWMTWERKVKLPLEKRLYLRFQDKLKRYGLERTAGETPGNFARRAAVACPDRRKEIVNVTRLYNQVCYQGRESLLPSLRDAVGRF